MLGVLRWSWVGCAWLTSVIDPEMDAVRRVIFAGMAALLIAALCVPEAFGDSALILALAYAVARIAHIALLIVVETRSYGESRHRTREELRHAAVH